MPPTPPILFRALLRLYPRAYRERYRSEMTAFFARERAEGGGVRFWLREVLDHVEAAGRVRARIRRERREEGRGMGRFVDDVRAAVRTLRRAPGFTLVTAGTLALGIGATTGVYTVLDRVVLRPLPYEGADRLVRVGPVMRHDPGRVAVMSPALVVGLEEAPGPFEAVGSAANGSMILTGLGDPERLTLRRVDAGFLQILEARAVAGRLFGPDDVRPGAPDVVLLSHAAWTRRFGTDPAAVGSILTFDGAPFTVVGVLADGFVPPTALGGARDFWIPLRIRDGEPDQGSFFISTVGRLRPGAEEAEAVRWMEERVAEIYPPGDGPAFVTGGGAVDLRALEIGDIAGALGRVMAAVVLLLLIACVNVAGLLLTRGAERARELAVRTALGASRRRLVRQLLVESGLLAVLGGALGSALAWGALALFRRTAPGGLPRLAEATLDARVLLVCMAAGLTTVALFGLAPALRASRRSERIAASGRTTRGVRDGRLLGLLVATETALAVVLVVGSGLLAHDLVRTATEDAGFRADGVLSVRVDLRGRPDGESAQAQTAFWARALDEARAVPGVSSVAVTTQVPYTGDGITSRYTPQGHETGEGEWLSTVVVAGDFFEVMGMRFVAGRPFAPGESVATEGATSVAIVNQALVDAYWPGEDGLGRMIKSGGPEVEDEGWYEIVGVVADVRARPGVDPGPTLYTPLGLANAWPSMDLVARTAGDPSGLTAAFREVVNRLDPGLPLDRVTTMEALGWSALARPRFYTGLFGGFALVALLLAVVGVYGTTAWAARSRTRELGIRLALGAVRGRLVARVVGRTGLVLGAGVAAGLVAAGVGARFLADSLRHVEPRDAATYATVAAVVLAAGTLAAWIPAHRAGRVDPATTLREEA